MLDFEDGELTSSGWCLVREIENRGVANNVLAEMEVWKNKKNLSPRRSDKESIYI